MNVEIRTEAAQFPFWEYFVLIFRPGYFQCTEYTESQAFCPVVRIGTITPLSRK
jgi:hypothetical protein